MMEVMMGLGASEQGWRKGPWTPEEDKLLTEYVNLHGEGRWSSVAKCSGLNRSSKSCRLRWVNYLRPGLKRGRITPQEEGIIIELHALWGNKWSTIARYLPGRTDNEIKNYWRTHFKKKGKLSGKQEKRKNILQQQQQQEDINGGTAKVISPQSEVTNDQNIYEQQAAKQEILFRYPSMDFQCYMPAPPVMYQDAASWSDTIPVDGLWGGLWNLDDQPSRVEQQQASECGKTAIQNQPTCSSQGDTLNVYNGGYVF